MSSTINESPFHKGEQAIQTRLGVRESMEKFGKMVIRDHLPQQHRDFYQQLPFIVVGHADQNGDPWVSFLCKPPGFIQSPNNRQLELNISLSKGDPLLETLNVNHENNILTRLGLLGIELPSRRRNRLSVHVAHFSDQQILLDVDQAFGNCPQYIQSRELRFLPEHQRNSEKFENISELDQKAVSLIEKADTFFIASYIDTEEGKESNGADASHRGGRPGFIRVNDPISITIPDYSGNNHFNTFGNILENGKAGLLFIDFDSGDILTITGDARINWDSAAISHFEGAQRLLEFTITKARWIKNSLPVRWGKAEFSPNSMLTGTWKEAAQIESDEAKRKEWLEYQVTSTVKESDVIRSFHLRPVAGKTLSFMPGQFLTIKADIEGQQQIRTYTVSNSPNDSSYRISVKREIAKSANLPDGVFSNYIHDQIKEGDRLLAKAPNGNFYFDTSHQRPAVLFAAGIGITPMVSILREALIEAVKTRHLREITLIAVARNERERVFYDEINDIVKSTGYQINVYWFLTQPEKNLKLGVDYEFEGRPEKHLIEQLIRHSEHDAYLCGPGGFMQSAYDDLRAIGIEDKNIYAESFGPSSLKRDCQQTEENVAKQALISIKNIKNNSVIEQPWSDTDGSLLEFLEGHGISPTFGCRSGQCGSCKTQITKGKVTHTLPTGVDLRDDELLLCCAKPEQINDIDTPEITLIIPE